MEYGMEYGMEYAMEYGMKYCELSKFLPNLEATW